MNTVNEAMRQVIRDPSGTGHTANIEGVDLRGKTGTAEIKQSQTDTKGTEIGWFVTIMPATNNRESIGTGIHDTKVKERGRKVDTVVQVNKERSWKNTCSRSAAGIFMIDDFRHRNPILITIFIKFIDYL